MDSWDTLSFTPGIFMHLKRVSTWWLDLWSASGHSCLHSSSLQSPSSCPPPHFYIPCFHYLPNSPVVHPVVHISSPFMNQFCPNSLQFGLTNQHTVIWSQKQSLYLYLNFVCSVKFSSLPQSDNSRPRMLLGMDQDKSNQLSCFKNSFVPMLIKILNNVTLGCRVVP